MTYLKMVIKGGQRSSEVGKEGFYLYEHVEVKQATQDYVVLLGSYRPNEYELEVFLNGIRQAYQIDYDEIDNHTVRFHEPLEEGDELLFMVRTGKSNTVLHEIYDASEGQTVFMLNNSYHPNRGTLMVFDNGQLLTVNEDYVETDEYTVTFLKPFNNIPHKLIFHEIV